MPRLAIVIPALGRLDRMEATLLSVLENRPPDCEVLVVHRGDYADPYDLAGEVAFVVVPPDNGLAACLAAASDWLRSSIVHVLSPGVLVQEGWCESALVHFRRPDVASVTPMVLDVTDARRVLSAGLGYHIEGLRRHLYQGADASLVARPPHGLLGPSRLAGFYRREIAEDLVYDEWAGDEFADVDLALRLKARGYSTAWEPACIVRADAEADAAEPSFERGRRAERIFWRHARSRGLPKSLVLHGLALLGELGQACCRPRVFAQILGRVLAAVERTPGPTFVEVERPASDESCESHSLVRSTAETNRDESRARGGDRYRRVDGGHGSPAHRGAADHSTVRRDT